MSRMKAKWTAAACLLLVCALLLPGCSNYRRLAEAIGNLVRPTTEVTTARPTTRRTTARTERATPTPRPATTTTTTTAATTTEQPTVTTAAPTAQATPTPAETTAPLITYSVQEAFRFEDGAVTVVLPLIEPDDERSGALNEELALRIAYEQSLCEDGFEADVYYAVDYFSQFDETCLTLAIESIAGWVDSEAYYLYSVYHYDLSSGAFLDNRAYLDVLQIQPDRLEQQVQAYAEANLEPEFYQIRSLDEAMFVIFDGVLYYEVISLEFEDFWLEDMGPVA